MVMGSLLIAVAWIDRCVALIRRPAGTVLIPRTGDLILVLGRGVLAGSDVHAFPSGKVDVTGIVGQCYC